MPPALPLLLALALQPPPDVFAAEHELSEEIRPAELQAHVYRLASPEFAGRKGAGAARAARYVEAQFRALKLAPAFGDSYFQTIPARNTDAPKPGELGRGRNVGAVLEGSDPVLKDEWIVLSAHFDHLGERGGRVHPGADDNASGTAMLLEVAERFALQKHQPRRTIVFVAFDLEEVGLLGSAHFAAHPPRDLQKLKAFLTGDMLGRGFFDLFDDFVVALGSESSPGLRKLLEETPPAAGLRAGRIGSDVIGARSDYAAFRDRHVPYLFFCTGLHADYHQPTDTPDRINYANLARVSDWVHTLTQKLADADSVPAWAEQEPEPDLDEVRTILAVLSALLDNPQKFPLSDTQRKVAGGLKDGLAALVARGKVTPAERAALVKAAQWLLANGP
jgi:Peptidase family M28